MTLGCELLFDFDCSDFESALRSFGSSFGLTNLELERRLRQRDWRQEYVDLCPADMDFPTFLVEHIVGGGQPTNQCGATVWFHATRVRSNEVFGDGLLPASQMRRSIQSDLRSLAITEGLYTEQEWEARNTSGSGAENIVGRVQLGPADDGPHAFLIRDVILRSQEIGLSDFFSGSETARDICESSTDSRLAELLRLHRESTVPTIVKFRTSGPGRFFVCAVLGYLHCETQQSDLLPHVAHATFCADGQRVPHEAIVEIQREPFDAYLAHDAAAPRGL